MLLRKKIQSMFLVALAADSSPRQLVASFCIGLYIAFSPFPGLHSVMIIASKFIFRLHLPTVFIVASFNNPWTMIPMYSFDYALGYWLTHTVMGWEPTWIVPLASLTSWIPAIGATLSKSLGSGSLCVWSFLIGGNVAGIVSAGICYPLISKFIRSIHLKKQSLL